jgi:hypothetical protein
MFSVIDMQCKPASDLGFNEAGGELFLKEINSFAMIGTRKTGLTHDDFVRKSGARHTTLARIAKVLDVPMEDPAESYLLFDQGKHEKNICV